MGQEEKGSGKVMGGGEVEREMEWGSKKKMFIQDKQSGI